MKNKKIPKKFKLFGTTMNVIFDDQKMQDMEALGLAEYCMCRITLASKDGVESLGDDRIVDSFYHEKVHLILDSMGETELSKNEKFVDIFAKLWRQSDETAEY